MSLISSYIDILEAYRYKFSLSSKYENVKYPWRINKLTIFFMSEMLISEFIWNIFKFDQP